MYVDIRAGGDDVFVVTGAASGVGAACVEALTSAGGRVAGLDITAPPSSRQAVMYRQCDVRSPSDLEGARQAIEHEIGAVTHLVHSAARFTGPRGIDSYSEDELRDTVGVNVLGSMNVARAFLPSIRQRPGAIVFIGSIVGTLGAGQDSVYAASKAAIDGLAKSLAVEEASSGTRINVLLPGNVLTPQRALTVKSSSHPRELSDFLDRMAWTGRSAESSEIAHAVLVLLSDGFDSLTGSVITMTGGSELGVAPKQTFESWLRAAIT